MRALGDLRGSGGRRLRACAASRMVRAFPFVAGAVVFALMILAQTAHAVGAGFEKPPEPDKSPLLVVSKWAGEVRAQPGGNYLVPIKIRVENRGGIKLYDLLLEDAIFRNIAPALVLGVEDLHISGDLAGLDRTFDGVNRLGLLTPGQSLKPGQSATIRFLLSFSANGHAGPFWNQATGSAETATGEPVADLCSSAAAYTAGSACRPAEISLPVTPQVIGLAKDMSGPIFLDDGTLETTISFVVENFGSKKLRNVQISDPLSQSFSGRSFSVVGGSLRSDELPVDSEFNGVERTNLLAADASLPGGASAEVSLQVRFNRLQGNTSIVNQATATADGATDLSTAGTDPDPNGDGVPDEQQLTALSWVPAAPRAAIGLANAALDIERQTDGRFRVSLLFTAQNLGETTLNNVQIENRLTETFVGTATFDVVQDSLTGNVPVNRLFDGDASALLLGEGIELAPGALISAQLAVIFDPGMEESPFFNQARATARVPDRGELLEDVSTDGRDPDPDADGNPIEAVPTPIPFVPGTSSVSLVKSVGEIQAQDGG